MDIFGLNQGLSSVSFIVTSFKTFSRSDVSFAKDDNAIVTRKIMSMKNMMSNKTQLTGGTAKARIHTTWRLIKVKFTLL